MAEKLDLLKKNYSELAGKYQLPDYKTVNEEFDIEKLQEIETETLLREIRKVIMDKVISYLRFAEMLINPCNAPMFFFAILKGIDSNDKKLLDDIYTRLGRLEIKVIDVDNDYSEDGEAEFIRHVFEEWREIKENMKLVSKALQSGWDKKREKKDKSYLG
ncbi:MAG: hypothetical protein KKB21_02145 [Nanoarchaeota archaeon]|nr:hypothetical protein [Nanoarchaeota archaeon]MBU4086356.1 hypothetical protein [Nanoarchaeota archaeon]